jgi:hypothetical protein
MILNKKLLAMGTVLSLGVAGCGGSSKDGALTGGSSIGDLFDNALTAISSSATVFDQGPANVLKRSVALLEGDDSSNDPCPGFGGMPPVEDPEISNDDQMNETMDSVACMLTADSGSPETAKGAMSIVSQIMASAEAGATFVYANTATDHENLSFSVTTSDGEFTGTMSVTEKSLSSGPWQSQVDVCIHTFVEPESEGLRLRMLEGPGKTLAQCKEGFYSITLWFKNSAGATAFKFVNRMFGTPAGEAVAFSLNQSSGKLNFESWSLDNENHTRYFVDGAFDENFNLDTVNDVVFAHARGSDPWSAVYATFDGENLCANYQSDNGEDLVNLEWDVQGSCGDVFVPTYDAGFHDWSDAGFNDFLESATKGLLSFGKDTFGINSFFIDN